MKKERIFYTPQTKENNNSLSQSIGLWNNSSRGFSQSKRHRHPIFQNNNHLSSKGLNFIQSTLGLFEQQKLTMRQVMNDDFCGCQNLVTPCDRIASSFFKNVSFGEMKRQYQNVGFIQYSKGAQQKAKSLIAKLPQYYPQIFVTHLKNLIANIKQDNFSQNQFTCLAWIQYHCKVQYVTFFFYNDLKKYFKNKGKFLDSADISLIKYETNLTNIIRDYNKLNLKIQDFINSFYQSVGASLIPVSQYATFLQKVGEKGQKALIKLLCLFLVKKKDQLYNILKFWTHNQIRQMREYVRELNWEMFFQELDNLF